MLWLVLPTGNSSNDLLLYLLRKHLPLTSHIDESVACIHDKICGERQILINEVAAKMASPITHDDSL
jgi:hypothetical protein